MVTEHDITIHRKVNYLGGYNYSSYESVNFFEIFLRIENGKYCTCCWAIRLWYWAAKFCSLFLICSWACSWACRSCSCSWAISCGLLDGGVGEVAGNGTEFMGIPVELVGMGDEFVGREEELGGMPP